MPFSGRRNVRRTVAIGVLVFVFVATSIVRAEVILYDGFPTSGTSSYNGTAGDRNASTDLQNQNAAHASMVGFDAGNPWSSGTATINVDTRTLLHPFLDEQAGMVRYDYEGSFLDGRSLTRNVVRSATNYSQYYVSGLMLTKDNFSMRTDSYVYTQLGDSSYAAGVQWGFAGDGTELDAYVQYRDADGTTKRAIIANGVSTGDPTSIANLFVIKLSEGGGTGDDTIEVWYNPTSISSEAAAGTPVFTDTTTNVLDESTQRITKLRLGFIQFTSEASSYSDEIRMASSWEEGVLGVVPEPSSFVLLVSSGLLGLLFLGRRHRKP